jgi:Leucine-rich repeat (LRR) protein
MIANNLFAGYFNQTPLEEIKNTLVRIDLSHNQITHLPTFGYLEKLRYFDFSHNLIESIEASSFTLLFNLYSLDLTANNISAIEKNAFSTLSNLFYLRLGNNSLSQVPSIEALTSLIVLDIRNQNGTYYCAFFFNS